MVPYYRKYDKLRGNKFSIKRLKGALVLSVLPAYPEFDGFVGCLTYNPPNVSRVGIEHKVSIDI